MLKTMISNKNMVKDAIVAIIAVAIFATIAMIGISRHEKVECLRWQRLESDVVHFYLTPQQKAQCEHHGISVK